MAAYYEHAVGVLARDDETGALSFVDINFCPTSEGANVSTDVTCCLAHPTDIESGDLTMWPGAF